MMTIKTGDIATNTTKVARAITEGETVVVSRPKNQNWVILSEREYNNLMKAKRNADYISKLDQGVKDIADGKGTTFTMAELEKYIESKKD